MALAILLLSLSLAHIAHGEANAIGVAKTQEVQIQYLIGGVAQRSAAIAVLQQQVKALGATPIISTLPPIILHPNPNSIVVIVPPTTIGSTVTPTVTSSPPKPQPSPSKPTPTPNKPTPTPNRPTPTTQPKQLVCVGAICI